MYTRTIANVLALSATVYAIAFDGPLPTPVDDLLDFHGWSPKPTNEAREADARSLPELFRRQRNSALCGYIEGDGQYPVTCTVGNCFYNTRINWFGCCTGTVLDSCNIATRCVASASVNSCLSDASCSNDDYITACTAASAPYCAVLYSVVSQQTISHAICAATSTQVQILASSTGGGSASRASGSGSAVTFSSPARLSGTSSRSSSRLLISSSSSDDTESESTVAVIASRTPVATSARPTAASAPASSSAAAPMQTAKAIVGGIVGAVAMLF